MIKKKSAPGKFYKQTVQNIPYFNKKNSVYDKKKAKHRQKSLLLAKKWRKKSILTKKIFQRTELFALIKSFAV